MTPYGLVSTVTAGVEEQGKGISGFPGNVGEPVVSNLHKPDGGNPAPKASLRSVLTRRAAPREEEGVGRWYHQVRGQPSQCGMDWQAS